MEVKQSMHDYAAAKADQAEHERLCRLWAMGKASRPQIERCMKLSQKLANKEPTNA